jgi:hypothetical protein
MCLSACISAASTGQISVKFDIGGLYANLSRKFKLAQNRAKISGTLHKDLGSLYFFWWYQALSSCGIDQAVR